MKYLILSLVIFFSSFANASEYLLIKNGKVVNRVVADSDFANSIDSDYDFVIQIKQTNKDVGLDWDYDNGVLGVGAKFTAPVRPVIPETPGERISREKREAKGQLKDKRY